MSQFESSARARNPLPEIVVTCLVLGILAYLFISFSGQGGSGSFMQMGAVIAAIAYLLTFANLRLGIGLMILCIGLSPEISVGNWNNLRYEDFLIPALLVAWILRNLRTHEKLVQNPIQSPFLIYLVVMALSLLLSLTSAPSVSFFAVGIVGKNFVYFAILLVVVNNIRSYQEYKAFLIFILLVGIVSAATSTLAVLPTLTGPESRRLGGPVGETATTFGGYLAVHICLFLGLFLYHPTGRGRTLSVVCALFLSYIMLLTMSRTTYVSLAAGVGFFALAKQRKLIFLIVILAVVFPLMAPGKVIDRAMTITGVVSGPNPESYEGRTNAWRDSLPRVWDHPVLGSGPGTFPFGWLDNEYVRVIIDFGLVGLFVFLWFLYRILITTNRLFDQVEGPGLLKGFVAGYYMAFANLLVHCWGSTSFTVIRTMETFMVFTGLLMALKAHYATWREDEDRELAHLEGGHIRRRSPGISPT